MPTPQHEMLIKQARSLANYYSHDDLLKVFKQPVIILSAPRAGSTLLFETLKVSDHLWSIGTESHFIFNAFPELHPSRKNFESGALNADDANPELCHLMRCCFLLLAVNNKGQRYLEIPSTVRPGSITFMEKTPRNALNIPFMLKLFPDMRVIFLYRDPRENISSIIEAWNYGLKTGQFVPFRDIPGWDRENWCLLLPPGWREMKGKSIAEIAAFQWVSANGTILQDLKSIDADNWIICNYRRLVDDTSKAVRQITEFLQIPYTGALYEHTNQSLPLSNSTVSAPKKDKWKINREEIEALVDIYRPVEQGLHEIDSI